MYNQKRRTTHPRRRARQERAYARGAAKPGDAPNEPTPGKAERKRNARRAYA